MKKLLIISILTALTLSVSGCGWQWGEGFWNAGDTRKRMKENEKKIKEYKEKLAEAEAEQQRLKESLCGGNTVCMGLKSSLEIDQFCQSEANQVLRICGGTGTSRGSSTVVNAGVVDKNGNPVNTRTVASETTTTSSNKSDGVIKEGETNVGKVPTLVEDIMEKQKREGQ